MPPGLAITHIDLMLATAAGKPFDDPGWVWELKLDGFRCLAIRDGDRARMFTRRGNDLSACFPEVTRCLLELEAEQVVLDGELVVLDEGGKPDFDCLCRRARKKKGIVIEYAARAEPAVLIAFDTLALGKRDLRKLPLLKRKETLRKVLADSQRIRAVQYIGEQGVRLYEAASALELEGVVAKKADSPYRAGRSKDWIKIRTPAGRRVQEQRSEEWDK